jgi:hypothetical protein
MQIGISGKSVGRVGHEAIGEQYLRSLGFGEKVCKLVGSHVAAKRYVISHSLHFRHWQAEDRVGI